MFGWEFPPFNSGGLGVACRGLTKALYDADVSVIFVLPRRYHFSDTHVRFRFPDGSKEVRIRSLLSAYLTSSEYEARLRSEREDWAPDLFSGVSAYASAAHDIALEETFDVIHAHDWLAFPAGLAAKRATEKPLILHVHLPSLDQGASLGHDSRVFDLERESFEAADAIIAISGRVRDLLEKEYGVPSYKIHVVHNGLSFEEDERFVPLNFKESGGFTALYMGRLTVHKGPDVFLRAAEIVARHEPKFSFVMAGSGELEHQLMHQAAQSGIGSKIFFAGFARGAERKALIRYADMLVMPSVAEPFGLVALEAAAEGTPVILSKQSGVRDVLRNSLAADFWDVEELAHHMLAVARYQPLRNQLSSYGAAEAQLSTWEKAAERCMALYTGCVSGP